MRRLRTWQLLAICVLVWGTTWCAITFPPGHTAPELGVALRFGVAGAVVLALCKARGLPLRFDARTHGLLALQGSFLYGVSYVGVCHAEQHWCRGCSRSATRPRRWPAGSARGGCSARR